LFRLLIVDDEQDITDGLYELFRDFDLCELDVCKAYSGKEALAWIRRTKFDIVLTDIRMPGFTGLQLMEAIREQWPKCRIIFLTGHHEFDYVYSAIKYDGVRYLLKMESHETIVKEVEDAVHHLIKDQEIDDLLTRVHQYPERGLTHIQEQFVLEWLNGNLLLSDDLDFKFKELGIMIHIKRPILPIVCNVESDGVEAAYPEKLRLIHSIQLVFQKYLSETVDIICLEYEPMKLLCLAQPAVGKEREWSELNQLLLYIHEYLDTIQEVCRLSLHVVLSFALDNVCPDGAAVPEQFHRLRKSGNLSSGDSKVASTITNIQAYIEEHIGEDLSLVKLAEMVHINPSYLSRLFKKVTGKNLLYYINDKRIDQAKTWLEEDQYKIYEIAEKLGFATAPYFTRFFKKKMKVSPQDYRESRR